MSQSETKTVKGRPLNEAQANIREVPCGQESDLTLNDVTPPMINPASGRDDEAFDAWLDTQDYIRTSDEIIIAHAAWQARDEEVKLLSLGTETDRQRMIQHGFQISNLEAENKRLTADLDRERDHASTRAKLINENKKLREALNGAMFTYKSDSFCLPEWYKQALALKTSKRSME